MDGSDNTTWGDIGNVCRCICGDASVMENTTVLVSAKNGCKDCTTDLCSELFMKCALAEKHGGAVSVHCIDRSAITPRIAIASLIIATVLLVIIAIGKERIGFLRKIHGAISHKTA